MRECKITRILMKDGRMEPVSQFLSKLVIVGSPEDSAYQGYMNNHMIRTFDKSELDSIQPQEEFDAVTYPFLYVYVPQKIGHLDSGSRPEVKYLYEGNEEILKAMEKFWQGTLVINNVNINKVLNEDYTIGITTFM